MRRVVPGPSGSPRNVPTIARVHSRTSSALTGLTSCGIDAGIVPMIAVGAAERRTTPLHAMGACRYRRGDVRLLAVCQLRGLEGDV